MPPPQNPTLLDFPDHFETERLLIRAPRASDGAAVAEAVIESLANLKPWMPWAHDDYQQRESELFVRRSAAQWITRENLAMLLFRRSDGLFVGGSGLHRIDWTVPKFEIGYWVRVSLQGQGFISEAVNGITAFAFETLGAKRVEIHCDANNTRSAAVAERCGYSREARLHNDHRRAVDGSLRDTLVFAKTAGD